MGVVIAGLGRGRGGGGVMVVVGGRHRDASNNNKGGGGKRKHRQWRVYIASTGYSTGIKKLH